MPQNSKGAQSVHRTVSLVRSVAKYNKQGVNLSKIARDTGLHTATAHRILAALVLEGFLTYDSVSKLYHLGIDLYHIGKEAHHFSICERYHSVIEKIADKTEDTVFLLIRSGNDVLCLDLVEGKFPIRTMTIEIGAHRPLGIGVGSLALIAFLSKEEFETVLSDNQDRYPDYNGLTKMDIAKLAKKSQKDGFIVSKGLFHEGVTSVGVPVKDRHGKIAAAITVAAIDKRMNPSRRKEIAGLVIRISSQSS
jgi:DNA-binding IclR family transcriptional regulator